MCDLSEDCHLSSSELFIVATSRAEVPVRVDYTLSHKMCASWSLFLVMVTEQSVTYVVCYAL